MDEWLRKLPPGACCYALSEQSHPVAFKDVSGRYIGANNAFEDLLGYSRSELVKMRWQDITLAEDIYGEQSSFESIMQGNSSSYMATKRYRHKMGHYVSVVCVIRRWPVDSREELGCFVVDVSLEVCTLADLRDAREQSRREIDTIKASLAKIMERNEHGDINITAGNTGNSDRTIYALVGAVVVLGIVVIWIAYYVFGNERMTPPPSPRPTTNATAAIGAKN